MLRDWSAFLIGPDRKALQLVVVSHFRNANRVPVRWKMLYSAFRFCGIRQQLYIYVVSHFRDANRVPVRWKMLYHGTSSGVPAA